MPVMSFQLKWLRLVKSISVRCPLASLVRRRMVQSNSPVPNSSDLGPQSAQISSLARHLVFVGRVLLASGCFGATTNVTKTAVSQRGIGARALQYSFVSQSESS